MREILKYITTYIRSIPIGVFIACTLMMSLMIYLNFHYEIDPWIDDHSTVGSFLYRYLIFLTAFALPYFFYFLQGKKYFKSPLILLLIFLSPAIFALKMVMPTGLTLTNDASWNYYWNEVTYWPIRLVIMSLMLFIIWKVFYSNESF